MNSNSRPEFSNVACPSLRSALDLLLCWPAGRGPRPGSSGAEAGCEVLWLSPGACSLLWLLCDCPHFLSESAAPGQVYDEERPTKQAKVVLRRPALLRNAMCRIRCSTSIVIIMQIHSLLSRCARSSAYTHQSSFAKGSASFRIVVPTATSAHTYNKRRSLSSCGPTRRSAPVMMPEGPEVRTLVDQLQPAVGMRLTDLRFLSGRYVRHGRPKGFDDFRKTMTPFDKSNVGVSKRKSSLGDDMVDSHDTDEGDMLARALTTRDDIDIVTEWKAKGKFIYMILDDGNPSAVTSGGESDYLRSIWITLGMSGKFVSEKASSAANYMHEYGSSAEDGARWYLDFWDPSSERTKRIFYHDTRNFGTLRFSLSESELIKKLATLGLDILDPRTTVEGFLAVMDRTKPSVNICKFLMDQKKISGVGNYILAEGLYRSNIDPFACISELTEQQKRTLFDEIQATAQLSYASQGVTRLKGGSYRTPDGEMGKFQFSLQCYGQEKCPRGRPVIRETEGPHGRTIWYVEDQLFVPRNMRGPKGEILDKPSSGTQEGKKPKIGKDVANLLGGGGANNYAASETDTQRTEVLVENLADGITDPAWKEALSKFTSSATFTDLADFVQSERSSGVEIYPPQNEVFSALNLCPLDKVKVVIVGQDPYHQPNQGHGLAFSVKPGVRPPPSLQNIFREAMDDVGIEQPKYGYLVSWATQGVLLLNTVLTVRRGQANSHARRGWEQFTDEIIGTLNEKEGLVFLLWGGPAQKKAASVDTTKHTIIKTSHPSPLGASKTRSPFLGSKCFSRANKALIDHGKDPIDWSVV